MTTDTAVGANIYRYMYMVYEYEDFMHIYAGIYIYNIRRYTNRDYMNIYTYNTHYRGSLSLCRDPLFYSRLLN